MNDDVLGEVLVYHGPLRSLLRNSSIRVHVAARRIQRRWRSCRLVPGTRVLWRFVDSLAPWEMGLISNVCDRLCITQQELKAVYVFLPHPNVHWKVLK
jgi:hypothetical protein